VLFLRGVLGLGVRGSLGFILIFYSFPISFIDLISILLGGERENVTNDKFFCDLGTISNFCGFGELVKGSSTRV
jgi:hypothetical protein